MPNMAEMSTARQEWLIKRQEQRKNKAIEGRNDVVAGSNSRRLEKVCKKAETRH
jgi:hypothetical protein